MRDEILLKELAEANITDLAIGDVRFRRKIKRAGYERIIDALALSDSEIDAMFDWNTADVLVEMKARFERDPISFACLALRKGVPDKADNAGFASRTDSETVQVPCSKAPPKNGPIIAKEPRTDTLPEDELGIAGRSHAETSEESGSETVREPRPETPPECRSIGFDAQPDTGSSEPDAQPNQPPQTDEPGLDFPGANAKLSAEKQSDEMQDPPPTRIVYHHQSAPLPNLPFFAQLVDYDRRAAGVLDELNDRFEDVMVYQAFDEFATELDDIERAFELLFAHYKGKPRQALRRIDESFRDVYIVYLAERARAAYDGGNLWGNLFGSIGVDDGNVQAAFKRLFVDQLRRRGMPLYGQDEAAHYYFYTALLHGGLSEDSWVDLWMKSLLPLAKKYASGQFGFGGEIDGRAVLREIKATDSRFAPRKSVLAILEKAPDATIVPLFDASFRVADQMSGEGVAQGGYVMLSSFGLPDAAMQALRTSQELANQARSRGGGRAAGNAKTGKGATRIVYLPMASLQLDLATGTVLMRWPKQQFPLHFAGGRIDYYVNESLAASKPFSAAIDKCILDSVDIAVEPQDRYDVELKLMQRSGEGEDYEEKSSLRQSFSRNKPHCFEFVRDAKGVFHLRGRNERISKRRRIAYIVSDGFRIEPGYGMVAVSEYDTAGAWSGRQIALYDVEPGASGSIVDTRSDEEVAVWQERYSARIDRRRIIGETEEGLDLYGFVPNRLGTNAGLPRIRIQAFDGVDALDDLDVVCLCDGARVSVPRHVLWADGYGESNAAEIALALDETNQIGRHVERCEVVARQKSAEERIVFRYRFAIVPIQGFRLTDISFDFGCPVATYEFQAVQDISVENAQGDRIDRCWLTQWGFYEARMLLSDEYLRVRIESYGRGELTIAKLALAALSVEIPMKLLEIAKERPICLADVCNLGAFAANFKVSATGNRYNRAAMAIIDTPVFYSEMKRAETHGFNLFDSENAHAFAQKAGEKPHEMNLSLCVWYGDDVSSGYLRRAWAETPLLACREGLGFNGVRITINGQGIPVLRFDGVPLCNLHLDFKRKVGGRQIVEAKVPNGCSEVELPSQVVRLVRTGKKVSVLVAPAGRFGKPLHEWAVEFDLSK